MNKIKVSLTEMEGFQASIKGVEQMYDVIRENRENKDHGGESDRSMAQQWGDCLTGLQAEMAFFKHYNLFWGANGTDGIHGSDAYGIEIRSTEHERGHLLLYKKDIKTKGDHPFVLITGSFPDYKIIGWVKPNDICEDKYWRKAKPSCYWIPQNVLKPMSELELTHNNNGDITVDDEPEDKPITDKPVTESRYAEFENLIM